MARITPEEHKRPLSVGQIATRSGVAVSTIHFYESKGLITGWRSSGNQRRYGRDVLRRVAVIKVAQRLGLPLATILRRWTHFPEADHRRLRTGSACRHSGALS